jgi:hypothetical protein
MCLVDAHEPDLSEPRPWILFARRKLFHLSILSRHQLLHARRFFGSKRLVEWSQLTSHKQTLGQAHDHIRVGHVARVGRDDLDN